MADRAVGVLPGPDEYADLTQSGGQVGVPVWHLNGAVFEDLGGWVRSASSIAPMEIAGHNVNTHDLEAMEHDLLALLAAVRSSRAKGADESQQAAGETDYDAPWTIRGDGLRVGADRMRTRAYLAAWQQMRIVMPPGHWSIEACDAIAESVLRTVRDWVEAS